MRSFQQTCLGLMVAGVLGCGTGSSIEVVRVTGKVTLDDQPLEKGLIHFLPTDGKGSSAACEIQQGEYQVDVQVGNKRIEVTSPKVIGKQKAYDTPDSPTMDILQERIPAEYNVQSQLKASVSKDKKTLDFPLKSKSSP